MVETRARDLASSLGQAVSKNNITLAGGLSVSGLTTYATKANLPGSYDSTNAGSLGFTTDSDRLYIHTGAGWHNVAIINTTPVWVTQPSGSYALATDATAYKNGTQTDIILRARDSEGVGLTWSATTDTAFNNMAHIAQDSTGTNVNKFIIEPKTRDSAGSDIMPTGTVTFKASDGVNIATAASTFTLSFDATITNSQFSKVLAKASGNNVASAFTDGSTNTHSITANGTAQVSSFTPHHPAGYSMYFDGDADQVDVAASGNFLIGTGNFTLECWITCETKTTDTYWRRIYLHDGPSGNSNGNLQLAINPTSGSVDMWSNSGDLDLAGTIAVDDGKWHHVAVVRSGTTLTSYIDGALNKSGTYSSSIGTHNSSQPRPRMGSYSSGNADFKGHIRDLRLVVGTAVYTGVFVPPTVKLTAITNTKLLIQAYPILKDNSGDSHAITANIGTPKTIGSPYKYAPYTPADHGISYFGDGDGDYLSHNDIGTDGLNDFTIEAWVFNNKVYNPWANALYSAGAHNDNSSSNFVYIGWGANGEPVVFQPGSILSGTNGDIQRGHWQHVAFVRASNQVSVYINGVKKTGPVSMTGALPAAPTGRAFIGTQAYDAGHANRTIGGYISDFRIHNTAVYTSNFTPPTAKLAASTGTQYLLGASSGIYNNTGGNIQLVGNTKSSTGSLKYASSNMDFDGTGDYITFDVTQGLGSGDFTLEAWIYHDTLSNYQSWFSSTRGATGFNCGTDADGDFVWYDQVSSSARKIEAASQISGSTWYHVAFVRSNGVIRGYLNGVQKGSDYASTTDFSAEAFAIGTTVGALTETMDGHIEDFRLTKDLSRYPFIPLKETLTTSTSVQSGITVTASNTKLLTAHAASITDGSATGHTVTASGNAAVSNFGPADGMKSIYLDGTGDYLTISSHADFNLDQTADWTAEFWMWLDGEQPGSGGTPTGLISKMTGSGSGATGWYISFKEADDKIQTGLGNAAWVATAADSIGHNKWVHIAVTMTASSNTHTVFINGFNSGTSTSWNTGGNSEDFLIGKTPTGGDSNLFKGYISNLRIVRGQAIYTNNFTPPAAALAG